MEVARSAIERPAGRGARARGPVPAGTGRLLGALLLVGLGVLLATLAGRSVAAAQAPAEPARGAAAAPGTPGGDATRSTGGRQDAHRRAGATTTVLDPELVAALHARLPASGTSEPPDRPRATGGRCASRTCASATPCSPPPSP